MALSFIIDSIKVSTTTTTIFFPSNPLRTLTTKTAYHTHFLNTQALHQQPDTVGVPPSRGSTFSKIGAHHASATPSDRSSHTSENEHLPPLRPPQAAVFRHHVRNGYGSTRGFPLNNHNKSPPSSARKNVTKSMNTTTTIKKATKGGIVSLDGRLPASMRTTSSESNRKARRFWWSPQRAEIEVRSDENRFRHIPAKIGSFDNIEHRPGGGQVSIRDDRVRWQAASKIDSLSNANWSSPAPRVTVRTEKIKWDVQPKIGSLLNIDHKPAGGNVAIRDDKIDFTHVTPRIDCGFLE